MTLYTHSLVNRRNGELFDLCLQDSEQLDSGWVHFLGLSRDRSGMISVWNNRAYRRVLDLDLREDAAIAIGSLERVHFPKRTEYAAVIQPHPRVPYELVMTWEGFFITGENSKVFDRFPCSFDVESGEAYKGNRVPVHMHSGVLSLDKDPKVLGPMGCGM